MAGWNGAARDVSWGELNDNNVVGFMALWVALCPATYCSVQSLCMPVEYFDMASGSEAAASAAEEDGADVGTVHVSSKRNAANRRALAHLTQISGGRVQIHKVRHIAMSWQCGRNHRRKGIRAEGTEYCLSDGCHRPRSNSKPSFLSLTCA